MTAMQENPYAPPKAAQEQRAQPPKQWLYYGWVIIVGAALAMVATLPARTHGLGLVTKPLLADLHLSQEAYGHINLWATLLGAAFCLPCGWLLDRFGVRLMLSSVLAALGLIVMLMSGATDSTTLFLLVTLTRGLGQSMLSVVSITMVGKWFARRLGLAMGFYSLLVGVGFSIAFKSVGAWVLDAGWRTAWFGIGAALSVVLAPLALLLMRSAPLNPTLEFGLPKTADSSESIASASLSDALWTPCFWVFAVSTSFYGLISSGLSLFNQLILEEHGFSPDIYHNLLAISSLTGMFFNLLGGVVSLWISPRYVLAGALALLAVSLAVFPWVQTIWQVYAYAAVLGAAGGLITVVFFSIWGYAFGPRDLGSIQGLAQMLTVFASAVGPLIVAAAQTRTGSYTVIFPCFASLCAVLSAIVLVTPIPKAISGAWASVHRPG
jgi:MFS family permease